MTVENLVILGSGPAGCTAAIYAARANLDPVVLTGLQIGGQLTQTSSIENWPGEAMISGFDLMEKMQEHAKSLGAKFVNDEATEIDYSERPFTISLGSGETIKAKAIIIATGANPKFLGLSSESKFLGNGISTCATCDGFFYKNKEVAVVGGGNTALQDALYLANICKKVYLIHRRDTFRAENLVVERVKAEVKNNKIELVLNSNVKEILGTDLAGVTGLTVVNKDTNEERTINVPGVFIAVGHKPNSASFAPIALKEDGTIETGLQPGFVTSCSVPGIFAAGDVADDTYRQAITSAGTGCKAALDVERFLKIND